MSGNDEAAANPEGWQPDVNFGDEVGAPDEAGHGPAPAEGVGEAADAAAGAPAQVGEEEPLAALIEAIEAERDEWKDLAHRNQAEFENFRKQSVKRGEDNLARGLGRLVEKLLPILDACDGAIAHGESAVEPIRKALLDGLASEGLEAIVPVGEAFDPNRHDAVMTEPADDTTPDGATGPIVSAVMRPGYAWKGGVLRPAMVSVKG